MDITVNQVTNAGIKKIELAAALGLTPGAISHMDHDRPMRGEYQFKLLHGSPEARRIYRKVRYYQRKQKDRGNEQKTTKRD